MLGFRKKGTKTLNSNVENTQELLKVFEELVKKGGEIFDIFSNIVRQPKSLEEMTQLYSEATTRIIKNAKEEESLKFFGGTFKIELLENGKVKMSMEAYFKSFDDQWIKKENSSTLSASQFTEEAYGEIKKEELITYELIDPS